MSEDVRMWLVCIGVGVLIFVLMQTGVIDTRGWGRTTTGVDWGQVERERRACDRVGGMGPIESIRCGR